MGGAASSQQQVPRESLGEAGHNLLQKALCCGSKQTQRTTKQLLKDFDKVFWQFDPKGTQKVSEIQLLDMLLEIEYPLGLKNVPLLEMQGKSLKEFNDDIIQQLLVDPVMRSTNVNGLILFVPLKQALVSIMYDRNENVADDLQAISNDCTEKRRVQRIEQPEYKELKPAHGYNVAQVHASKIIQTYFRASFWETCFSESELIDAFKVFDNDGDGFISATELRFIMTNLGDKFTDDEIDRFIHTADIDDDDGEIYYPQLYVRIINKLEQKRCLRDL